MKTGKNTILGTIFLLIFIVFLNGCNDSANNPDGSNTNTETEWEKYLKTLLPGHPPKTLPCIASIVLGGLAFDDPNYPTDPYYPHILSAEAGYMGYQEYENGSVEMIWTGINSESEFNKFFDILFDYYLCFNNDNETWISLDYQTFWLDIATYPYKPEWDLYDNNNTAVLYYTVQSGRMEFMEFMDMPKGVAILWLFPFLLED